MITPILWGTSIALSGVTAAKSIRDMARQHTTLDDVCLKLDEIKYFSNTANMNKNRLNVLG